MSFLRRAARCASQRPPARSLCGGVLRFSEEVASARREGRPVVALESTIISHGMPRPHNLQTAIEVENIIRDRGATPATIAILGGVLHVGLSPQQLQHVATARGVAKASRRDLPALLAAGADGATTVAGSLVAVGLADIPVFVTGGIGGVHREGESTLDVSADLPALGRSRALVVCSGVKSILDVPRTLEYLETQGVCVCAFGESRAFPAFYTRSSGLDAPHRARSAAAAAALARAARRLALGSAVLIAVPVPKQFAMDEAIINSAIDCALAEARAGGVRGKDVTPRVLAAVAAATGGASLDANIALIKNNARVGADIAVELNRLEREEQDGAGSSSPAAGAARGPAPGPAPGRHLHTLVRRLHTAARPGQLPPLLPADDRPVLVIGGANVDRTYSVAEPRLQLDGSTHRCGAAACAGGVARNMAEALWRMRGAARLLAAVGDDADGRFLQDLVPGLFLGDCAVRAQSTASYAAVLDARGECVLGLGDMAVHDHLSEQMVSAHEEALAAAALVVLDGNAPAGTVLRVLDLCQRHGKPVFFEPTDRRKAIKIMSTGYTVKFASPNLNELRAMAHYINGKDKTHHVNIYDEVLHLAEIVSQSVECMLVTLGAKGVVVINSEYSDGPRLQSARLYRPRLVSQVVSVSGAGDCFSSGFIVGALAGCDEAHAVAIGFQAAEAALKTHRTVPSILDIVFGRKASYETLIA